MEAKEEGDLSGRTKPRHRFRDLIPILVAIEKDRSARNLSCLTTMHRVSFDIMHCSQFFVCELEGYDFGAL